LLETHQYIQRLIFATYAKEFTASAIHAVITWILFVI